MMKPLRTLTFFSVALLAFTFMDSGQLFAQGASVTDTEIIQPTPPQARPGTYRLIVTPGGENEVFTKEILVIAEQLRQEHVRVSYPISNHITIEIFSRDEVRSRSGASLHSSDQHSDDHEE